MVGQDFCFGFLGLRLLRRPKLFDQRRYPPPQPVRYFLEYDCRAALHGDVARHQLHRRREGAVSLKRDTRSARLVERSPELHVRARVNGPPRGIRVLEVRVSAGRIEVPTANVDVAVGGVLDRRIRLVLP